MTLLIVVVVALVLYVVLSYNGMIKLRNRVKEAWSDIDVQLKRRYNLIPNIIETVKGYAAHEEGVFTKVTEARSQAINATGIKGQGAAENMLSGALKSLFAVAESYPDLKANENFMQLQNELVDTEDKIQSARRFYNSVVKDFNTKIQQFPAKIIAQVFKFKDEEFFEADEEQKENVEVSFNKDNTQQAEAPAKEATPAPVEPAVEEEKPAESAEPVADSEPVEPVETTEEPVAEETPAEEPAPEEPKEEEKPDEEPASNDTAEPQGDAVETSHGASPDETDNEPTDEPPNPEEPKEEEKPAEPEPAEPSSAEATEAPEEKPEEPTSDDTAEPSTPDGGQAGDAVKTSHGASTDEGKDKETTDEPPEPSSAEATEAPEEKKEEGSEQAKMPLDEGEKKDA